MRAEPVTADDQHRLSLHLDPLHAAVDEVSIEDVFVRGRRHPVLVNQMDEV